VLRLTGGFPNPAKDWRSSTEPLQMFIGLLARKFRASPNVIPAVKLISECVVAK